MRGDDEQQLGVFSYVSPEQRIPHDHPLRQLRVMADEALREIRPRSGRLYAKTGRPSIAPEKLLRALRSKCCRERPNARLVLRVAQDCGIASSTCGLLWDLTWWGSPGDVLKIEKLRHIYLGFIALRERLQAETRLNEFKDRCIVGDRVRDVIFLREWGHDEQRHSEAGVVEIAVRVFADIGTATNICGGQVDGRNAIRVGHLHRRDVIVSSARFVVRENKNGILPRRA